MLTTGSSTVLPCKVKCLHQEYSLCRSQPAILKTGLFLAISSHKNEQLSLRNQTSPSPLGTGDLGIQTNGNGRKMNNMVVCCSLEPGPAPPFPFNLIPAGPNWLWILGAIVSVLLSFTTSKWGPLLKLKNEADNMMEAAEHITDVVEEVAEKVEKIADEVGDQLPDGGKLQATLQLVEDLAEETAKNARRAGDLIDKVQEMEDKMEWYMESVEAKSADGKGNEKNEKTKEA
ncbi:PREDICTED: uncharacterized protein LOC18592098 [Theobroma cacao]|uniref:Uncharacterized protein LOC18592098 n=1 Tax=Theobroma cacao TaxID=3641 RepID=A0AB32UVP0_THECC|nr:PREDICTED: uncharacterized protein LOC18592098 [Theobroma cacao]